MSISPKLSVDHLLGFPRPFYTVSFKKGDTLGIGPGIGRAKISSSKVMQAEKGTEKPSNVLSVEGTSVGRESRRKPGALEAGYNRKCEQTRLRCLQEQPMCRVFFFYVCLEYTRAVEGTESNVAPYSFEIKVRFTLKVQF